MDITSCHGHKYLVLRRLSNGVFGRVYECHSTDSDDNLVVKIIQGQTRERTIQEIKLMLKLKQRIGFPQIQDWGEGNNGHDMIESMEQPYFRFIVQKQLGMSLKDVVTNNEVVTIEEVRQIGTQLIKALRELHSLGYVHLDIKPDNILLGLNDRNANLIDFGCARRFWSEAADGRLHHKKNLRTMFNGNIFWSSKWVQQENSPSRRDDIISVIYSLVFLLTGYDHICGQSDISGFIQEATAQEFCVGAEALAPLLEEAYKYEYSEKPNYNRLIEILNDDLDQMPEDIDELINEDISEKIHISEYNLNYIIFA